MKVPFYIVHYRPNCARKLYLDEHLSAPWLQVLYIEAFDREEINPAAYPFDEAQFLKMLEPIWPVLVGYVLGLHTFKAASWAECMTRLKQSKMTFRQALAAHPWLRPKPLTASEISVFLKHRSAWSAVATGNEKIAIVAEDDILLSFGSLDRLARLIDVLPTDFDYVDIAGGCGLFPRLGNQRVNDVFFRIEPPRDRTACCAIISRAFAKRLVALDMPIAMPVDWSLTYAFKRLAARVYWAEPTIFTHGSEAGAYPSSI